MSIKCQSDSEKRNYIKDAVLMSLHAAEGCGLTEDVLRNMLPLIHCKNVCAEQFSRILKRMRQDRLIALNGLALTITPRGLERLHI